MGKPKTTRRVRIKADFVVELDRDVASVPFRGSDVAAPLFEAAIDALKNQGVVAVWSPFQVYTGVDYRHLKVTPEERRIMRHALGLDRAKVAYRNGYGAPASGGALPTLESLTERGFMERGDGTTFHVTPAGIDAVTLPREREKPEEGAAS